MPGCVRFRLLPAAARQSIPMPVLPRKSSEALVRHGTTGDVHFLDGIRPGRIGIVCNKKGRVSFAMLRPCQTTRRSVPIRKVMSFSAAHDRTDVANLNGDSVTVIDGVSSAFAFTAGRDGIEPIQCVTRINELLLSSCTFAQSCGNSTPVSELV